MPLARAAFHRLSPGLILFTCFCHGSAIAQLATARGAPADSNCVRVAEDGHWLEYRGKPILLIGDSITQGWMELGENFDQHAYLDALRRRGINAVLLWSYIGITDQQADSRIGYDAPELWPWHRQNDRFDLARFNGAYFRRLHEFVRLADERDIVIVITVHDGWTKTRFAGHPFSRGNGGTLATRRQYVELHDYDQEMAGEYNDQWSRQQKHQYYLERFCEQLIDATADLPNVMYEMFNEGEWYDQKQLRAFQEHFLAFFRARTTRLLVINDDHIAGRDFRGEENADVISLHTPRWDDLPSARVFFEHYAAQFHRQPPKPLLFGEPVPEYAGDASRHQGVLRMLWGTALGGAGIVFQNDASWGFDPRSALAEKRAERDTILDFEGHLARFFNDSSLDFARMEPQESLASTGVCSADPPDEYVVFAQDGERFTVDLSAGAGRAYEVRWHDPASGTSIGGERVEGGQKALPFVPPFEACAVLRLTVTKGPGQ